MQIHYELAQAAFRFSGIMFNASTNYSMHIFANIFVLDLINNLINLLTQHTQIPQSMQRNEKRFTKFNFRLFA